MPINKNALIRYQVLDKCFSNFGRKYFREDLLEEVNKVLVELNGPDSGIKRTQFYKDLDFMKSEAGYGIELGDYKEGKRMYYRYTDPNFSIKKHLLSHTEQQTLKEAIRVLSQFQGLPQFEWLNELVPILSDKLAMNDTNRQAILFDSNVDYTGTQYIVPIFNAIHHQTVLGIKYQGFNDPHPYDLELHPYILKQYNNRWFVLGYNDFKNSHTWNLALDRILSIRDLPQKAYHSHNINWEDDYFYDIIGVTRIEDQEVTEVVLEFAASLIPYIRTKPIHPSQREVSVAKNGDTTLSIEVIPNYELERLLRSFGARVKIISPEWLKEKLIEELTASLKQYDEA
ncbi:MAG TPA: WYL domain-containing protein [Microscillaceae bacterium]|nr:WYL domain-containing protein [Microscillaceae bacterium]